MELFCKILQKYKTKEKKIYNKIEDNKIVLLNNRRIFLQYKRKNETEEKDL
jgi:hypothetical protein